MRPRLRRSAVGAVALLSLVLAACQPATTSAATSASPTPVSPTPSPAPTASAPDGATLRWAVRPPRGIVPWAAVDATGLLVVDTVFDSLTALDADGEVLASAATRWEPLDGGLRWRFLLRPGATFHDGTPVTAQHFARAWARTVADGLTGSHLSSVAGYRDVRSGVTGRLDGVLAVADDVLEVTLTAPDMDFPAVVAHPSLAPVPPQAFDDGSTFAVEPVGNGPFRMAEPWARGQFIRVVRAADWSNGPRERSPERVREIVFRVIDADGAYVGFQQGRIDVAPVPAGALAQAERTFGTQETPGGPGVVDGPLPGVYFLGVDVDEPPWDDPALRRALSRAIDRDAVARAQGDRRVDVARSLVPPLLRPRAATFCDACLHLPTLAADTFADAGVTEATLTYDLGGGHEPIVERIRIDLAAVGVELTATGLPFEEYLAALERGEPTMFRFGWQAQRPTAGAVLEAVAGSGAPVERGDGANYTGYASETVDALLEEARAAESPARRDELWAEAEALVLADMPVVPLFHFRQRTVISTRVEDLVLTPWGTAMPERARIVADPEIVE